MCFGPELMFAAKIGSAALTGIGASKRADSEIEAHGRRSGQILFDTKIKTEQAEQAQERRRGATRASFAKQGVKVKGTAARLVQEQINQDELELLKIKHSGDVRSQAETAKAMESGRKGGSALIKAGIDIAGELAK